MVTGIVPHVGGPILPPGEPTVLIGMLPAARMTDMLTCVGPPDTILMGSPTVLIGNLMAARIGDPTAHGGVIVLGEPTVEIGEVGMGTPMVSTPMAPLVILAQAMAAASSPASQAVSNAAQSLAQSAQDGTPSVEFSLANQPLARAAGATAPAESPEAAAQSAETPSGAPDAPQSTVHAAQRAAERGISQADIDEAIRTAKEAGQVTSKVGKYGTPQHVYKGTNNVTVVVESAGRNQGKAITVFRSS